MRTHAEITSLADAVADLVHDGDTVALEGFTHLIPVAAGHEIIRQRKRDLTLVRMTPDIVYDQLIGAGCARKLIFSWGGNPGVGSLHRFREAVQTGELEIEEHSHAGMANRYVASASGPAVRRPARLQRHVAARAHGHDQADHLPVHRRDADRGARRSTSTSAIIHAQRADRQGNVQLWGQTGVQKETVLGAKRSHRHRRGDRRRARRPGRTRSCCRAGSSPACARCRAAPSRPTRRTTTSATTTPTARGTRSSKDREQFDAWLEAL